MAAPITRIRSATVPACLIDRGTGHRGAPTLKDGLVAVDLVLEDGRIAAVAPSAATGSGSGATVEEAGTLDLRGGMLMPGLIDGHTHLDKSHIWPRRENPDGTFPAALAAAQADREQCWTAEDLLARAGFALRCAYAHGTVAVRTHLDSIDAQTAVSWDVFDTLRADWADRITLQAVSLSPIDLAGDASVYRSVVARAARSGGIVGAVTYPTADVAAKIDTVFRLAMEAGLALDLHVDENLDPSSVTLRIIAETALRLGFTGPIQVGHCCSLSVQDEGEVDRTLGLVAEAGIAVVTLPMCNLYLQDRRPGRTPRCRGVTLLHEMTDRGIRVSAASDNTRDPFFGYGDLDMVEVWREVTRIAQLDRPFADWARLVTGNPARAMGLADRGRIAPGLPADLIAFPQARTYSELFARPQSDRIVLRGGRPVDRRVPDYRELDPVVGPPW